MSSALLATSHIPRVAQRDAASRRSGLRAAFTSPHGLQAHLVARDGSATDEKSEQTPEAITVNGASRCATPHEMRNELKRADEMAQKASAKRHGHWSVSNHPAAAPPSAARLGRPSKW